MLEGMNVRDELARARYGLGEIAKDSSVPRGYVKQLSAGNQGAGPDTLRKLGRGLGKHARRLLDVAAHLLASAGEGDEASRLRAAASDVRAVVDPPHHAPPIPPPPKQAPGGGEKGKKGKREDAGGIEPYSKEKQVGRSRGKPKGRTR
jgi:hypothetical protein